MDSSRTPRPEAIGQDRPPALVRAVAYATVALGLFWLIKMAVPWFGTYDAYDFWFGGGFLHRLGEGLGSSIPTLAVTIAAARLLWLRHRWGRYLTITYWAFSFAGLHGIVRDYVYDVYRWVDVVAPGDHWRWETYLWEYQPVPISLSYFAFMIPLAVLCWLLFAHPSFETRNESHVDSPDCFVPGDATGSRPVWRLAKPLLLSLVVYWLVAFTDIVPLVSVFVGQGLGRLYAQGEVLPAFLGSAAFLLFMSSRRLDVNARKVSLYLGNRALTLFEVPWFRVRRIVVIEHNRHPRTAVFYYDSRFLLPFSMAIHAKRWQNGEQVIDKALDHARRHAIPVIFRRSPDFVPWLAWAVILSGLACGFVMFFLQIEIMQSYVDGDVAYEQLGTMPQPIRQAALASAVAVLPLLGLGLLSAFHRGAGRPVLLFIYASVLAFLPTPLMFWLVWVVIYVILTGILQPVAQLPHIPIEPLRNWDLAYAMVTWSPVVGLAAYFVGVFIGQRRVRAENAAPRLAVSD